MPYRTLTVNGVAWRVAPSGYVTPFLRDEFSLVFTRGEGSERESRVARYSPRGARTREESFAELTEPDLLGLFAHSEPGAMSPETHYSR